MRKYMYSLILSLVLSGSALAERSVVQVNDKDCFIKVIEYNEVDNIIWAKGNCQVIYKMCEEDFCNVRKVPVKDLNFGSTEEIGSR